MMFVCSSQTFKECMDLKLFGLPFTYMNQVQSLKQGKSALFLYDTSSKRLHGVFEAASDGADNINKHAWQSQKKAGSSRPGSPFPAQIEFRVAHSFKELDEAAIRSVIRDTQRSHIRKLNTQQVRGLIAEFHKRSGLAMPESRTKVVVVTGNGQIIDNSQQAVWAKKHLVQKKDDSSENGFSAAGTLDQVPVATQNPFNLEPDTIATDLQQISIDTKVFLFVCRISCYLFAANRF